MVAEYPHYARSLASQPNRGRGGPLRAAHKDIEEQELPSPNLGERKPSPPGREEGEKDPDFVEQSTEDDIPTFKDKTKDFPDPSFEKGVDGPGVLPPDDEDI